MKVFIILMSAIFTAGIVVLILLYFGYIKDNDKDGIPDVIESKAEEIKFKQPTIDMFNEQSNALYASARLWDDGIIDPRKSREVLAMSLKASLNAPIEDTKFGNFRM